VDFDPGAGTALFSAGGGSDVFVASYDATGAYRRAFTFGGDGLNTGQGIAVDAVGDVVLTGTYTHTTDFDPGDGTDNRTSAGQNDLFMAKYDPESIVITDAEEAEDVPDAFHLSAPYPNPFSQQTQFTLTLPAPQHVTVEVFDLLGRKTAQVYDGLLGAGMHRLAWKPDGVASGLFVLRAKGDTFSASQRVVLAR
ncbi:MAG: T9SS type A sorting domain-containing protein, partial [Rhodothermales bacterium]